MADPALESLIEGLIDYAGLFPPAGLSMEEAVRNDAGYRAGEDAWMLGRFVVPATRAAELREAAGDRLPPLSVIVRAEELTADAAALPAEAFEMRLPEAVAATGELPVFLEPGWRGGEGLRVVAADLAAAREAGAPVAMKLRCGGLDAAAFPSSRDLAVAIVACRAARVPFKATAGLHHPTPRLDDGVGARMHGFLNVFGGAVLASVHGLRAERLAEILDDDDPAAFRFEDGRMRWRDLEADAAAIREARSFATSFGSCSFDEPREDLRALGLLPASREGSS